MSYSYMHFRQSRYIYIANVEFIGCGGNLVIQVQLFVVQNARFSGQESSDTALQLIKTTACIFSSALLHPIRKDIGNVSCYLTLQMFW